MSFFNKKSFQCQLKEDSKIRTALNDINWHVRSPSSKNY